MGPIILEGNYQPEPGNGNAFGKSIQEIYFSSFLNGRFTNVESTI